MATAAMADATAALILHRQAEFTRQFSRGSRSQSFASSVADRFFSDNSLDRQRRVVECTKRRQAKAQQRAQEQEYELRQLEQAFEHKQRLRELQNERESSRMRRKLQHVAAAYIQYVYRQHVSRRRRLGRRRRAAEAIAEFSAFHWRRKGRVRSTATRLIQQRWRQYSVWKRKMASACIVLRTVWAFVERKRQRRKTAAAVIQRWLRSWMRFRRWRAVCDIQRAWRLHRMRLRLVAHSNTLRRANLQAQHNAAARIIQLHVGRFAVKQRVLRYEDMARYHEFRVWAKASRTRSKKCASVWSQQKQLLAECLATAKRLQAEESSLLTEIEALQVKATEFHAKKADEQDRLKRFCSWIEVHRAKEEEQMRDQLRDWEIRKRFEIRMELEREVEMERRLRLRAEPGSFSRRASQEDTRVEVDGAI